MLYSELLSMSEALNVHTSFTMCRSKAGRWYMKLRLTEPSPDGLYPLLQAVERKVGTQRTFSHCAARCVATFTLYGTAQTALGGRP